MSMMAETTSGGDPDAVIVETVTRLKDEGNAAYKRRDLANAARCYGEAIRVVMPAVDPLMLSISSNPRAPSPALLRLRAALCCNRGAVFLELAKLPDQGLLADPIVRSAMGRAGSGLAAGASAAETRAHVLKTAEAMLQDVLNSEKPSPEDLRAKAEARLETVKSVQRALAAEAPPI